MNDTFNPSYVGMRHDVIQALAATRLKPANILDVGCATGELGHYLKKSTGARVHGVELSPEMAAKAATRLDSIFVGAVEKFVAGRETNERYDAIILADVLEHTRDPWSLLLQLRSLLTEDGVMIISLPNVRHWSTIYSLLFRGIWPYRDRGIHDRTHLRFFTLANIREMVADAGMSIVNLRWNLRLKEGFGSINRFSWLTDIPGLRAFFVFQYILVCAPGRQR